MSPETLVPGPCALTARPFSCPLHPLSLSTAAVFPLFPFLTMNFLPGPILGLFRIPLTQRIIHFCDSKQTFPKKKKLLPNMYF